MFLDSLVIVKIDINRQDFIDMFTSQVYQTL